MEDGVIKRAESAREKRRKLKRIQEKQNAKTNG
jgi:hypothetical protein